VYKYQFDHPSSMNCLYENVMDRTMLGSSTIQLVAQSQIYSGSYITTKSADSDLKRTFTQNYLTPYQSKYSGGFVLQDTMRIPRPCAFKSSNLTSVSYYRGQEAQQYLITQQNSNGFVLTMMDENSQLVYQNGLTAADVATFDQSTQSVWIQTDSEDKVGVQRVVIRNCDSLDRLLELNLYINVLANTHPDFVS
jgi:hypothetical protein